MSTFTRLSAVFLALFLWQANAYADLDSIKKAAEAGDAERQLELGILYEYGFKFKGNNQVPALTWYMLSAEQGVAKAARLRDVLQAKLTAAQVQQAREEAEKLKATMTFKPAPVVEPKPEPAATSAPADEKPAGSEPKPATAPAVPATNKPAIPADAAPAPTPPPASPAPPAPKAEAPATGTTPPAGTAPVPAPVTELPK